jgi:hypothetical protein
MEFSEGPPSTIGNFTSSSDILGQPTVFWTRQNLEDPRHRVKLLELEFDFMERRLTHAPMFILNYER